MKTTSGATRVAAKTPAAEEKMRKSLHPLQYAATDKENLVGGRRTLRSSTSKDEIKKTISIEKDKTEAKKKKATKSKETSVQTGRDYKEVVIDKKDLTSETPSENYWEVVAERRRIALAEALEENKQFAERISDLEETNRIYKEQLDESKALIEVLKEMLGEDDNGINYSLDDCV